MRIALCFIIILCSQITSYRRAIAV